MVRILRPKRDAKRCTVDAAAILVLAACPVGELPASAEPQSALYSECAAPVWPQVPALGTPPTGTAWTLSDSPREWTLPPCVGWGPQQFSSFSAVVGRFDAPGMDAVLKRIGAIATYKGLRYWSVTDRRLEPLITDAFALEPAGLNIRRSDFKPMEMQAGEELYFSEHDNRLSDPVLYRMRIIERSPDHVVIDIANVNKIRKFLLTLFEPGELRTALFIAGSDDGWTCYALSGFRPTPLTGLLDNPKSRLNRLIALFGHIAQSDAGAAPWAK